MKLFLVRHGKSSAHDQNRRQSPNSPLGVEGKSQAERLSERLKSEQVDILFSSKWDRAKETAEAVSRGLNIPLELFEGIHEREHNSAIYGVDKDTDFAKLFDKEFKDHESDLDWKYEGEGESLRDVMSRTIQFRKHLVSNHTSQSVVVVTHEHFIRVFLTLVLIGDNSEDQLFFKVFKSISLNNTGITLLEYLPDSDRWELKYLNDHLHIR